MKKRDNILFRTLLVVETMIMWVFCLLRCNYLSYRGWMEQWNDEEGIYEYVSYIIRISLSEAKAMGWEKIAKGAFLFLILGTVLTLIGVCLYKKVSYSFNVIASIMFIINAFRVKLFYSRFFQYEIGGMQIAVVVLSIVIFITSIIALVKDLQGRLVHKKRPEQSGSYVKPLTNEGNISMVAHVLLLLFTFGIYYLVWIYKTTKYTTQNKEYRSPSSQLLLCMFVPFYSIYWIYKTAKLIDPESVTLCTVLAIFVPIVPPIILQDKINKECVNEGGNETIDGSVGDIKNEIEKYNELYEKGVITEDEYQALRKKALGL